MQPRIDFHKAPPGAAKVMLDLQQYVDKCGLEPGLLGSGPHNRTDGQIYTRRGGRGFYFDSRGSKTRSSRRPS